MKARLDAEVPKPEASLLWTAAQILMGLRYSAEVTETLLRGVQDMEESVTYQAIIRKGEARGRVKGRVEGERLILLQLGRKRLGEPSPEVVAKLEAMADESAFSTLADRLFEVSDWEEFLTGL